MQRLIWNVQSGESKGVRIQTGARYTKMDGHVVQYMATNTKTHAVSAKMDQARILDRNLGFFMRVHHQFQLKNKSSPKLTKPIPLASSSSVQQQSKPILT